MSCFLECRTFLLDSDCWALDESVFQNHASLPCLGSAAACRASVLPSAVLNTVHGCLQVEWQAGYVGPRHPSGSRDLQGGVFWWILQSAFVAERLRMIEVIRHSHLTELCAACRAGQHSVEVMQSVGLAEFKNCHSEQVLLACQDLSSHCCWRATTI